jgi:hypothetical protein
MGVAGDERAVWSDGRWAVVILGADGWVLLLDQGDEVDALEPRVDIERAVVGVEVVPGPASEGRDQQVRDVVAVLGIERGRQVGSTGQDGLSGPRNRDQVWKWRQPPPRRHRSRSVRGSPGPAGDYSAVRECTVHSPQSHRRRSQPHPRANSRAGKE